MFEASLWLLLQCEDGLDGNGTCECDEGFSGTACEQCSDSHKFGPGCNQSV